MILIRNTVGRDLPGGQTTPRPPGQLGIPRRVVGFLWGYSREFIIGVFDSLYRNVILAFSVIATLGLLAGLNFFSLSLIMLSAVLFGSALSKIAQ